MAQCPPPPKYAPDVHITLRVKYHKVNVVYVVCFTENNKGK